MDGDGGAALAALCRALAEIEAGPDDAVEDLVIGLAGVVAAAHAALVRAIGAAERAGAWASDATTGGEPPGPPTAVGWLAGRARLTRAAAATLLGCARALVGLPVLAEAFRRGEVSLDHVLALTAPLTDPPRLAALAGPAEAELTELARRTGPAEVRAAVGCWLRGADPAGVNREAAAARTARSLSLLPVQPGGDSGAPGRVAIAGCVPVDDARMLLDALRLAAPAGLGGTHTPAQRRADALLAVARGYLEGAAARHHSCV
ncbi:DUF222 domain-containing protein [Frankia nepalensis]|uniref:DUF222 domain-containing protein n=1 Tax=Frankia nepalensis TaxID=1836974 RepID=UPI001EE44153|nr:DUF222 domain-containing protein [Frankia nepalensis]